jgi:putative spermidine/putrescine transport system ATP-binding protein/spermidine/putrescine transport system ATP-binding protein
VRIETGDVLLARQRGAWKTGDVVELVVRAQRFEAFRKKDFEPSEGMNRFDGRIKDKSYMGGEVSYFIELPSGREIHVISMMRTRIYDSGDEVSVQVSPYHCHLLPAESPS